MTSEDKLREAITRMAGDVVVMPNVAMVIDRAAPLRRRTGFRVALIAATAATVGVGAWLVTAASNDPSPSPRSADESVSVSSPPEARTYDVARVSRANFGGGLDVRVDPGEPKMRIETEPDVYQDLDIVVDGDQLSVNRRSPSERAAKRVIVHVGGVRFSDLTARGGVDIDTADGVFGDSFIVEVSGGVTWNGEFGPDRLGDADISAAGGADVNLSGSLKTLRFNGSGGVELDARNLQASVIREISVTGGASAFVHALERFERAVARGGSTITYRGVAPEKTDIDISAAIARG